MGRLLLATHNKGKIGEYLAMLGDLPWELTTPSQEGIALEVEEGADSFEENAILKATAFAKASNLMSLADDSGLEVDALGGEPGPLAARYAGERASDQDRCQFLLAKLAGIPWEKRTARFRCVIAVAKPQGPVALFEGVCEGMIALEPQGDSGFGYDPIFYLPQEGKTMAQLSLVEKNRLSHRGNALSKARRALLSLITEGVGL